MDDAQENFRLRCLVAFLYGFVRSSNAIGAISDSVAAVLMRRIERDCPSVISSMGEGPSKVSA